MALLVSLYAGSIKELSALNPPLDVTKVVGDPNVWFTGYCCEYPIDTQKTELKIKKHFS